MKKNNEETFTAIPADKIVSETNRKYGGAGNIEILAGSIKAGGLINPPTVVANADGTYRVIAGRRRVEAARLLKREEVPVRIIGETDAARLEFIALAENVNRQDTHPLDEAETFKKLLEKGAAVEDVAALYDRTVAGIKHRVRLLDLTDEVKEMFREGKITLSGAALIAGLPPEDQAKFHKKFGGKKEVGKWEIPAFIQSVRRFALKYVSDKKCEKCKQRTFNTAPGLFDDYPFLDDVCLDGECYARLWRQKIIDLITASGQGQNTGHNIILGRGIPKFVSPKTAALNLDGEDYALLSNSNHGWHETKKKSKKNTAWFVGIDGGGKVTVSRVEYEKVEHAAYNSYSSEPPDPVKQYWVDKVPGIAVEGRKAVAGKVKKAYGGNAWRFKNGIREKVLDAVIEKRLREENRVNLAAAYLIDKRSGEDGGGEWREIDPDYAGLFKALFWPEGIAKPGDIPAEPLIQKLFFFLIATGARLNDLPGLDGGEAARAEAENTLFWKFAQMGREEYITLYTEIISAAVRDAAGGTGEETGDPPEVEE
jgi:ParB/RepB/Spo0J family partition protein